MENPEIARMLAETADLMEIAGEDPFRIRSYRNAAAAIESHPERIVDILRDPARDVTAIPGIGKGLAAALREIAERGSFARRDEMLSRYPPTALELLRIPGVGPKTVRALWEHLPGEHHRGPRPALRRAQDPRAAGHGAKTEQKILEGIAHYRQVAGRFLLSHAPLPSRPSWPRSSTARLRAACGAAGRRWAISTSSARIRVRSSGFWPTRRCMT